MNAEDGPMIELQPAGRVGQPRPRPLADAQAEDDHPQARQNLFLNEHLRSVNVSWTDTSSIGSNSDAGESFEHQALLEDSPLPQPNIAALYRTLYDYLRYLLVLGLFVYSFFLIFADKGNCHNGSGAIKKLPPVSSLG